MKKPFSMILCASLMTAVASPAAAQTDARIRQQIIRESIAAYPGNGACPYSVGRNGRTFGRRSGYSRPGGISPKCYASDVSTQEVAAYRQRLQREGRTLSD